MMGKSSFELAKVINFKTRERRRVAATEVPDELVGEGMELNIVASAVYRAGLVGLINRSEFCARASTNDKISVEYSSCCSELNDAKMRERTRLEKASTSLSVPSSL